MIFRPHPTQTEEREYKLQISTSKVDILQKMRNTTVQFFLIPCYENYRVIDTTHQVGEIKCQFLVRFISGVISRALIT